MKSLEEILKMVMDLDGHHWSEYVESGNAVEAVAYSRRLIETVFAEVRPREPISTESSGSAEFDKGWDRAIVVYKHKLDQNLKALLGKEKKDG